MDVRGRFLGLDLVEKFFLTVAAIFLLNVCFCCTLELMLLELVLVLEDISLADVNFANFANLFFFFEETVLLLQLLVIQRMTKNFFFFAFLDGS